jgi:hypothetical protein
LGCEKDPSICRYSRRLPATCSTCSTNILLGIWGVRRRYADPTHQLTPASASWKDTAVWALVANKTLMATATHTTACTAQDPGLDVQVRGTGMWQAGHTARVYHHCSVRL